MAEGEPGTLERRPPRPGPGALALLIIILAAGAWLRFAGLDFGLPQTNTRPDENHLVERASRAADGRLEPRTFRKPTLLAWQTACLFRAASPWLREPGETFVEAEAGRPARFYLLARALSCLYGIATLVVLYRIGLSLGGPVVGLSAAAFLAVSPLHMRDSHFATVDVAFVFFLTAAVPFLIRLTRGAPITAGIGAAILIGLGSAVKYTGLVGLLPLFGAALAAPDRSTAERWRNGLGLVALGFASFVAAAPYLLLDLREFLPTIPFFMEQVRSGHYGMTLGPYGFTHHLAWTLPIAFGILPLFLALAGGVAHAVRPGRHRVVLLGVAVVVYLVIGAQRILFARYVMPLLPILALFAGKGVALAAARLSPRGRGAAVISAALVVVAAAAPLTRSVLLDRLLMREDTRLAASRWLDAEIPEGARVLLIRRIGWRIKSYGNPQPRAAGYHLIEGIAAEGPGEGGARTPERDPILRGAPVETAGEVRVLLDRVRPDFVVVHDSPLTFYSLTAQSISELTGRGRLVHRESPWASDAARRPSGSMDWDQQDAFFAPLRRFDGIERPGPEILVYRVGGDGGPGAGAAPG